MVKTSAALAFQKFDETLQWFLHRGIVPIIVSPTPRDGRNTGMCLARSAWLGLPAARCNIDYDQYQRSTVEVASFLSRVAAKYKVLSLADLLCDGHTCITEKNGTFIYGYGRHLSHEGSRFLGNKIDLRGTLRAASADRDAEVSAHASPAGTR